jgi:hypothetical protein
LATTVVKDDFHRERTAMRHVRRLTSNIALVVTTAVITTVGGATLTRALADGPGDVIHACVKDVNGQVRLVADGEACWPNEHPVRWGVEGPPSPPEPAGVNMVAGIITPDGHIAFGEPYGGADFTVGHPATGLYTIDIAPHVLPGVRCPVTMAQSWFTDAYIKVSGWVCDPSGYHVTFVTSDGNDAGFWFQVTQIQDEQG